MRIGDLLTLFPELQIVAGGETAAQRQFQWVHVVEQPDIAHWLRTGDLVLTSGVSWPRTSTEQSEAVRQIVAGGVAGVLFATGRFLASVPDVVRSTADELHLPVLEAPFQLRFADIAEAAQRTIVGEYFEVTERADAIHRALTLAAVEAVDLSGLAERLADLLHLEVAIYKSDNTLLARAGSENPDSGAMPAGVEDAIVTIADVGVQDLPLHLDSGAADGLLMPVNVAGDCSGYLLLRKPTGMHGALETRVIQHAAAVIALHLMRQQAIAEVERRIHASFLEALLTSAYSPEDRAARERVRLHGLDPDGHFRIVIARPEFAGPALSSRREFELRRQLAGVIEAHCQSVGIKVLTTLMLSRVVFLWPPGEHDRRRLEQLYRNAAAAVGGRLLLAVGEAHAGLAGIPLSYNEAEQLLSLAEPDDRLLFHEDHLLLRLLSKLSASDLWSFQEAVLGRFEREPRGGALVETVWTLLRNGGNQAQTARALGLHRNTLRQRLARIERLLGRPLDDPETLTRLYVALFAGRLRSRGGGWERDS
ncbi:MAG: PucR family transcriptional regulator ligand-binding domain-containing protein [Thermaerobacter sp.]|nr:PucR family transcriptional regulator ligand-binding domain-containing protein [Thermaerobacter sp.]